MSTGYYVLALAYALSSYQVPKEVGKIGTESAAFIEPISQRKDGIQAMFAKQSQKKKDDWSAKASMLKSKPEEKKAALKRRRSPTRLSEENPTLLTLHKVCL
jgi:hypothetical protein